jgi:hypothetical protein
MGLVLLQSAHVRRGTGTEGAGGIWLRVFGFWCVLVPGATLGTSLDSPLGPSGGLHQQLEASSRLGTLVRRGTGTEGADGIGLKVFGIRYSAVPGSALGRTLDVPRVGLLCIPPGAARLMAQPNVPDFFF